MISPRDGAAPLIKQNNLAGGSLMLFFFFFFIKPCKILMEISFWVAVIPQSPIWNCKGHAHDYHCKIINHLNALEKPEGIIHNK